MSSDESTSTQLSVVSSRASVSQEKLKRHKPEPWEIKFIGNFLLSLYHRSLIGPAENWICKKNEIRQEFAKFVTPELSQRFKHLNGTDHIGTLLQRCGFLSNTPRGFAYYQLKSKEFFEFRNKELNERDKFRVTGDGSAENSIQGNEAEEKKSNHFKVTYEIDEDSPKHELKYEGTTMQERRKNYFPTNMACCICQMDFSTMDTYEEHVQMHNEETEFQYLKELSKFDSPIFNISYRLCKKSHFFCFTIETNTNNLIIEKIIIVQSRTMFYVHEMQVPYEMPSNKIENFYVDSHLFQLYVEQPIVIISHLSDTEGTRIIEQHHFFRTAEMPKVHFAVKPYRIPSTKDFKPLFKVPQYLPPIEIQHALQDDFMYEKLMKISNEFRDYIRTGKVLQPQTIGSTLTTLLHVEDMDTIKEYMQLMQPEVTLKSLGDSYSLKIKSKQRVFVENILSAYDDIILTFKKIEPNSEQLLKLILDNNDSRSANKFFGRIEDVNSGRVTFVVHGNRLDMKRKYSVIFRPSRNVMRYQYRALELLPGVMPFLSKFLFPNKLVPRQPSTLQLELFNTSIADNPEQLQAVRNIAEGPRNDATYIIFGPPGTGKTTTLVESILQLLKREDTKILVTASSNSACDELALRLCKGFTSNVDMPRVLVRIYAQSNEARIDNIDDLLLEHSNLYNYVHFYPDIEILHEYRIVVCTMSVVAKLATGKFGRQTGGGTLFTHLFIDEVAAATEVEALMPITSVLTPKSCLIIAGDHKQLGPILKSKRAEELQLGVSLMDRLLNRECYLVDTDTGHYDRSIQTRLRLNFRSHPAIVDLYSAMYYNYDLEARAKFEDVCWFKDWHLSPSKQYPIMFHCINGKSKCDNYSYSLYNSEEVETVMDYVKDLMYFGINGKPVKETDIGIISPYKKQYMRIREELNLRKWYLIETGSVETFQGREKNIIIVSFVRSNTQSLGFLESSRRLNVTISRAKSLLILVGNPNTLSINPEFQHIINECKRNKTLVGKIINSNNNNNNSNNIFTSELSIVSDNSMDSMNDLLKNCNLENIPKHFNNNQQKARRRRRYGRSAKADGNESDDLKDDDDVRPSTSKEALKNKNIKKNNSNKRDSGKVIKTYKGDKPKGDKINLDQYFNTLPIVPNTASSNKSVDGDSKPHPYGQQQQQQQQIPLVAQSPYFDRPQLFPHSGQMPLMQQQQYQPGQQGMPLTAQPLYYNRPQMFPHPGQMTQRLPILQQQRDQFIQQRQFYMQQYHMQQQQIQNQQQQQQQNQQQQNQQKQMQQQQNQQKEQQKQKQQNQQQQSQGQQQKQKNQQKEQQNQKQQNKNQQQQNQNQQQQNQNQKQQNQQQQSQSQQQNQQAKQQNQQKEQQNQKQQQQLNSTLKKSNKMDNLNISSNTDIRPLSDDLFHILQELNIIRETSKMTTETSDLIQIPKNNKLKNKNDTANQKIIKATGTAPSTTTINSDTNLADSNKQNALKAENDTKNTNQLNAGNKGDGKQIPKISSDTIKIDVIGPTQPTKENETKIKSQIFELGGKGVTKNIDIQTAAPSKLSAMTSADTSKACSQIATKTNENSSITEKNNLDVKFKNDLDTKTLFFDNDYITKPTKVETTATIGGGIKTGAIHKTTSASITSTTKTPTTSNIYPDIFNNTKETIKTTKSTVYTSNELNRNTARENIYPRINSPTTPTPRINNSASSSVPLRNVNNYNEDHHRQRTSEENKCVIA